MKKIFVILIGALVLGFNQKAKSQSVPDNLGQFVVFLDNTYQLTLADVVQISKGMSSMKDKGFYKLQNGKTFFVYSPEKWVDLMEKILTKVNGTQIGNIADELAQGQIVPWDDNISTSTTNYAVTKEGKLWVVSYHYKGGPGVRVLVYKGYPVLKVSGLCLNPNDPDFVRQAPSLIPEPIAPPVPPKKDTVWIQKEEEEKEEKTTTTTTTNTTINNFYQSGGSRTREVAYQPYRQPRPRTRIQVGLRFGGQSYRPQPRQYSQQQQPIRTGGYGVPGSSGGNGGGLGGDPRTGGYGG